MKKVITVLFVCTTVIATYAQKNENQKLTRQERKEIKLKEEKVKMEIVDELISKRKFVLKADEISRHPSAGFIIANKDIDYILLDSLNTICQFGSAKKLNADVGVSEFGSVNVLPSNAVGGSTIKGFIDEIKVTKSKKSEWYSIRAFISSNSGTLDIRMDISPVGEAKAEVLFSNNFRIYYKGYIYPADTFILMGE